MGGRRRALRRVGRVAWYALRRFEIESRLSAVALARRVWSLGSAERFVLVTLFGLTGLAAATSLASLPPATAAALRTGADLGLFVLAWPVALAAAASQRQPLVLALAGAWLVFYQVLVCGAWVGTPIAVLPIAWLGWMLFILLHNRPSQVVGLAAWLVAAAGLAYVSAGPSGLRRLLGWAPIDAQLLMWALLASAGIAGFVLVRPRRPDGAGFGLAFWGGLAAVGLAVGLSSAKDVSGTAAGMRIVFSDAGAIVVLFWLWTAGRVAAEVVKLTEWTVRHGARLLPPRMVTVGVPLVILASLVAGRVWPSALEDRLDLAVYHALVWAGIAALALLGWWALIGRRSSTRAILVLAWWTITWVVLHGVVTGSHDVVEAHEDPSARVVGFGLFAVAAGLMLELGKLAHDWRIATASRVRVCLALVALAVACAVALSATPGNEWETTRSLMVLVGMLHLGVPLALYETWGRRARGPALDVVIRIVVFAAGYVAAMAVLAVDPQRVGMLFLALPGLVVTLLIVRRRQPGLHASGGALAGALFASGLVAGWMHPNLPTIPFVPLTWPDLQHVDKPLLSAFHLEIVGSAWAIGGALGWIFVRRGSSRRHVLSPRAASGTMGR